MTFWDVLLIVATSMAVSVVWELVRNGGWKRESTSASYTCPCGTTAKVTGYNNEETAQVILWFRQNHKCEEAEK